MSKTSNHCIYQIAIPSPLHRCFDYLPPETQTVQLEIGCRVTVPFGRTTQQGIIVGHRAHSNIPSHKLKAIDKVIDERPIFSKALFDFLSWMANYYLASLGEILTQALPTKLRQGQPAKLSTKWLYQPILAKQDPLLLRNAPKQKAHFLTLCDIFQAQETPHGISEHELTALGLDKQTLKLLINKNLVKKVEKPIANNRMLTQTITLQSEQQTIVNQMSSGLDSFHPIVLFGITGSGKTEVYIELIKQVLAKGRQALVLIPEIGLTQQTLTRFTQRLSEPVALLHSALTDNERLESWLKAKNGGVSTIIGTRSALLADFNDLGLIVVDESHDDSFKQWEGFKYHARDAAVRRAQLLNIPIILGSATPSLNTLHNVEQQRYELFELQQRIGNARLPSWQLVDQRNQSNHEPLARIVIEQVKQEIEHGNQVLFFLNRRGYAPILMCHECGWIVECERCKTPMTIHHNPKRLHCHHCDKRMTYPSQCATCASTQLLDIGFGTQKLEAFLEKQFPSIKRLRIDRDSTRKKGALIHKLQDIRQGVAQLLIGTQMLAKGHHFPNVTLVVALNIDGGLYSSDFSATENMAQQLIQVAGRAGREEKPGRIMLQTHHPHHPFLNTLIQEGYLIAATQLLAERQETELPPFSYQTIIRCESVSESACKTFLQDVKQLLKKQASEVTILAPIPAPIEKRSGRFRWQLLLKAQQRKLLHSLLHPELTAIESLKSARKVRWSIDVDPISLL